MDKRTLGLNCSAITSQDEVLTVFEKVALGSQEICGLIIGPTCAHNYNPYDQEWNVTIPGNKPPVTPVTPPKVCTCIQVIFCTLPTVSTDQLEFVS